MAAAAKDGKLPKDEAPNIAAKFAEKLADLCVVDPRYLNRGALLADLIQALEVYGKFEGDLRTEALTKLATTNEKEGSLRWDPTATLATTIEPIVMGLQAQYVGVGGRLLDPRVNDMNIDIAQICEEYYTAIEKEPDQEE